MESESTSISKVIDGNDFLFTFNIDEEKIKRYNRPKPNFEIDESKSYLVKYLKENPKVAYIIY